MKLVRNKTVRSYRYFLFPFLKFINVTKRETEPYTSISS